MRSLTFVNTRELPIKYIRYKCIKERFDSEAREYTDDDFKIKETIKKKRKYAIDLDNKEVNLGDWEVYDTVKDRTPIKKSIWKKIFGGILIAGGIIAAPFSFGTTLVGTAGGIALVADS